MIPKEIYGINVPETTIGTLTELCFKTSSPIPTNIDLLFVFGSSRYNEITSKIKDIYNKYNVKNIYISGGINPKRKNNETTPEATNILNKLPKLNTNILVDTNATNTKENVENFFKLAHYPKGLKNIVFISKDYASGRCYFTLKKYFSQSHIFSYPYSVDNIDRLIWYKSAKGVALVIGEFERIKKYSDNNDIYLDNKSKILLEEINSSLSKQTLINTFSNITIQT